MPVSSATILRRPRTYRLAVLLCCLLSVLAPFSQDTVAQLIEGTSVPSPIVQALTEENEATEDELDLFRVRGLSDSWRSERKRPSSVQFCILVDSPDSRSTLLCARHAPPHFRGPVSEHARRNGCGGPLLC